MTDNPTPACEQTADEFYGTLTGFDEIAITQAFKRTANDLATNDAMQFGRALVFVHRRRTADENDIQAYNTAQAMPTLELTGYFKPEGPEGKAK